MIRPLLSLIVFTAAAVAAPVSHDADRAALLAEVREIGVSGSPGPIALFGPDAFSVISGKSGDKERAPLVAATRLERGRVVAFGHEGYLGIFDKADTGRLIANAVRWTAGNAPGSGTGKIHVALYRQDKLADFLKAQGFEVAKLDGKNWSEHLGSARVLVASAHHLTASDVAPLAKYLRAGGGLVTSGLGWGWQQVNASKSLKTDFAGNLLLAPAGIAWGEGTLDKTGSEGFAADPAELHLLNAQEALAAVAAHDAGTAKLSADELAQASSTLSYAMRSLPGSDTLFLPKIAALAKSSGTTLIPRPDKPIKADSALARVLIARELTVLRQAKPEEIRAHPAAEIFPGAVPKNAQRLANRSVWINTQRPAWHSTGLYAAPGEIISVEVPTNAATAGLGIRIGCHTDGLWQKDSWSRFPEISWREKVQAATTKVASPFGGLVYIEVPDKAALGPIEVKISGAVAAPYFILGKTTLQEWKTTLRNAPAPWAELECAGVILSVPSTAIRTLDDPEALMQFWTKIVAAEDELANTTSERRRPERIVPDVQISAGYMHSGYPIMTHLDKSVDQSVQLDLLKQGSWGHFHELGHNHQSGDWTFGGTTEVTCNLFSLYVSETICGLPPGRGHGAMEPAKVAEALKKHLATRASFERWKSEPFLALTMYNQLRVGFGWEVFKKLFAEYRALPAGERPKTDDEKRDQWMVRFSKATGKNLGPFFEAWGVPTSTTARDSIKSLPGWMPADWPKM